MTRPEAMTLTRDMYGHRSASQIVQYLAEQGLTVGETTVKRWANPGATKRLREADRARQRRRNVRVFSRIQALRAGGLSHNAVAMVLSVDFGREVSESQVLYCVRTGRVSRELSRVLFDEFVPGAIRAAGRVVEILPESTRGEPLEGGCDARLPTPTPFGAVS